MKNVLKNGVVVSIATAMLVGCSLFKPETPKIDYKSAQLAKPLEVPPDLLHPTTDDQYTVPAAGGVGGSASTRALLSKNADGSVTLVFDDAPDRAWRRVGLALDRSKDGFNIDTRDRTNKLYQVHYHDPDATPKKASFFARLFGAKPTPVPQTVYQIAITPQDGNKGSKASLLTEAGAPETADKATPILQLIQEQLQ